MLFMFAFKVLDYTKEVINNRQEIVVHSNINHFDEISATFDLNKGNLNSVEFMPPLLNRT